jgi:hypothetical protein
MVPAALIGIAVDSLKRYDSAVSLQPVKIRWWTDVLRPAWVTAVAVADFGGTLPLATTCADPG